MEDIVIKAIENGYLVTVGSKNYVSRGDARSLNKLINKILDIAPVRSVPPPMPEEAKAKAKKVSLK